MRKLLFIFLILTGCNEATQLSKQDAQEFADKIVCAFSKEQRRNGACWCFVKDNNTDGVSMTLVPKEFCK